MPESLNAERKVEGFQYRDAVLDITVKGYGDTIKSFSIDGVQTDEPVVSADMTGRHTVEIVLADSFRNDMSINVVGDVRTPMIPFVRLSGRGKSLKWYSEEGAASYHVYAGGKKVLETEKNSCRISDDWRGDLQVVAVAADGTPSFPSEPINRSEKITEHFEPVMVLHETGQDFEIVVEVPEDGEWMLSWNYANARGSLYSELTCGIRMLYVNGEKFGLNIFPNRHHAGGMAPSFLTDGWDMWGWTIPEKLHLKAGKNTLVLKIESDADNMSRTVNDFMLKGYSLTKY